jgi:hypothetical protein
MAAFFFATEDSSSYNLIALANDPEAEIVARKNGHVRAARRRP